MFCKVIHRTGRVSANTRPHQLHWGNQEMGTAISCIECSQMAGIVQKSVETRESTVSSCSCSSCSCSLCSCLFVQLFFVQLSLRAAVLRATVFHLKIVQAVVCTFTAGGACMNNHITTKIAGLNSMLNHPLCTMYFSPYQASSSLIPRLSWRAWERG